MSFAKKWELDGVVMASEPVVLAPQLVEFVKGQGMVCATYGGLNDEVEGATVSVVLVSKKDSWVVLLICCM